MSEQEKKNALPVEGTVEETKKEAWYTRLWRNKWVRRASKIIGIAGGMTGIGLGAYKWGFRKGQESKEEKPEDIEEETTLDEQPAE